MSDIQHIKDLHFDAKNANKGTERGNYALERSLEKFGAGRSILIDRHGNVIAGNKTLAKAGELGFEDVVVVQTDGSRIVAVQRMDLDIDDPKARELAIADNRVGQLDLEWDAEVLAGLQLEGVDLSDFWREEELQALMDEAAGLRLPDPQPQQDPTLESEVLIEIRCSQSDLGDFQDILSAWAERHGVEVNIS